MGVALLAVGMTAGALVVGAAFLHQAWLAPSRQRDTVSFRT